MTSNHGGLNTPSPKSRSRSKTRTRRTRKIDAQFDKLSASAINHDHRRKVREIVTVSGQNPRGHYPSTKGKRLKYESLIEQDLLLVLEVASDVSKISTQPVVLNFENDAGVLRYTPDILARILDEDFYVEVKPKTFASNPDVAARMKKVIVHMRESNLKFFIIVCEDLRADGLQDMLRILLAKRPAPGRYDPRRNATTWGPPGSELSDPELTARWLNAQTICNELLQRVMKRDPDSLFPI